MRTPVAIIGIACRLPGAADVRQFWDNLVHGIDSVQDPPSERKDQLMAGIRGGFLDDIDKFDHEFFNISRQEAAVMDPQQRLLLEATWTALEDAGVDPRKVEGEDVSVFVGIAGSEFDHILLEKDNHPSVISHLGVQPSIIANRLSNQFDFCGKSLSVNTACTSSATAIDLACQEIWLERTSLSIAAGVNILLTPYVSERLHNSGWLSQQGICRSFDRDADGYLRSEGVGVLILKPLSQAHADGDRVYAVIRESCVGHNGRGNGLGLPSLHAQIDLLSRAYNRTVIDPDSVSYIEANAVGAKIGDVIEMKALSVVLGKNRHPSNPLMIGSLKPNIGHAEGASGMAAVIKAALSCYHRTLPPTIHFRWPASEISLEAMGLKIQTSLTEINSDSPLRIGVSSFSFGGSNAHIILEEAATVNTKYPSSSPIQIIELSAKTVKALGTLAQAWGSACDANSNLALADIGFTANLKRARFHWRLAAIAQSKSELAHLLRSDWSGTPQIRCYVVPGKPGKLGLIFSGRCTLTKAAFQYFSSTYPIYRQRINPLEKLSKSLLGLEIIDLLDQEGESNGREARIIGFFSEYLVYQLLASWGLEASICIGYGDGKLGAATAAGILELEQTLKFLCENQSNFEGVRTRPAKTYFSSTHPLFHLRPGETADSYPWDHKAHTSVLLDDDRWQEEFPFSFTAFDLATGKASAGMASDHTVENIPCLLTTLHIFSAVVDMMSLGIQPDLHLICCYQNCRVVSLPSYPFEACRHWPGETGSSLIKAIEPGLALSPIERYSTDHLSDSTHLEYKLIALWSEVLERSDFNGIDNFFHLGGNSLKALRLITRIEELLGKRIALSALFQAPTVQELVELLSREDLSTPWYSLVPIQAKGTRPVLFAIHLLHYTDLAQDLGLDQPVYGLRYGIGDPDIYRSFSVQSIGELASHYIDEMRRFQPEGPYFLMGHSFGGVVAFEMAQQLTGLGQTPALLILIDSYLVPSQTELASPIQILSYIKQMGISEFLSRAKRAIQRRRNKTENPKPLKDTSPIAHYSPSLFRPEVINSLWQRYQPKPYLGSVIFFKCLIPFLIRAPTHPEQEWKQYMLGNFNIQVIPGGDHVTMLENPHATILSMKLKEAINKILDA